MSCQTKAMIREPEAQEHELVEFLRDPQAYRDRTRKVDVIETHISWVFLTDRFVYKLKKPVRFEFLDFSTVELRRLACRNELLLNRRLAPGVYLDLLPITRDPRGGLRLGGDTSPVDWVVKMHRLPAGGALDHLIRERRATSSDVRALADLLVRFYGQLPPLMVQAEQYWQRLVQHVRANTEELNQSEHGFDPWQIRRLHGAQMRFLHVSRELLINRARDGRIVDGHGDLRPEHVYLGATPRIIDCLEFNAELRAIDVVDELAFLAMECDALDAPWIGQQVLQAYFEAGDDRPGPGLIDFFKCYRACVRAKVSALRSGQVAVPAGADCLRDAGHYLALADGYAQRLGPPLLLVVRGLSGTGKSTLAEALSQLLGCGWISTDQLRRQRVELPTDASGFNTGRYSPDQRQRVYDLMFHAAGEQLGRQLSVVLDGTFLSRQLRQTALDLAERSRAVPLFIDCTCPPELALERVRDRLRDAPASEIRPEFLAEQCAEDEPADPSWPQCSVDTTEGIAPGLQRVLECLRQRILPECANPHE